MKKIGILGSTGSIGTQTLEIVRTNKDIEVTALAAGSNIRLLEQQIREFRPAIAAVWDPDRAAQLKENVRDLDVQSPFRYGWTACSGIRSLLRDSCNCSSRDDRCASYHRGD